MEDAAIVALYWARDEQALTETAAKFGAYCRKIADNILHQLNDQYHKNQHCMIYSFLYFARYLLKQTPQHWN